MARQTTPLPSDIKIQNYRDVLQNELKRRQRIDRYYSLRDFARDLSLTPAHLSRILRGLRGLSRHRASTVGKALFIKGWVRTRFLHIVSYQSGRSYSERASGRNALVKNRFIRGASEMLVRYSEDKSGWKEHAEIYARRP